MTSSPDTENAAPSTHWRSIGSILLLVLAAVLAPIVFLAGLAWPIFDALECQSSCAAAWTGPIVIWVIGAVLVGGLTYLGVRGIVRPRPPQAPRQEA
jgi:hypothetical protein